MRNGESNNVKCRMRNEEVELVRRSIAETDVEFFALVRIS